MASIDFRTTANRQADDLPWLYELRADDLFARCRIADERRVLDVTTDYSAWLPFRVPPPREASNEDLDALKSFYVELLQKPARIFDDVLDGPATADDGRAVLLYALEYALLTRAARCEADGQGAENFPLHLPCKRIATNGRLLRWCRDALRAPQGRRAALIISCVGLLRAGVDFLKKPRAAVEDFLGAGGREALWDDLVACLRRRQVSTRARGDPTRFRRKQRPNSCCSALTLAIISTCFRGRASSRRGTVISSPTRSNGRALSSIHTLTTCSTI